MSDDEGRYNRYAFARFTRRAREPGASAKRFPHGAIARYRSLKRFVGLGALLSPLLLVAACTSLRPQTAESECGPLIDCPPARAGAHPIRVCEDPTVLTLAHDLDHLEKHIDWYGSVVAKVPDVWGQARLTQYRDDLEKAMSAELDKFGFRLQGTLSRSDSAYFASATALSLAAQPRPPLIGSVTSGKGAAPLVVTSQQTEKTVTNTAAGTTTKTTTSQSPAQSPAPVTPLDLGDPANLVSKTDDVIGTRNPARLPEALKFGQVLQTGQAVTAVGIEPAECLAQKKRYLDFLAQIRRENEGDDTADSPGYSLNLMRIPVSVLPGKKTEVSHGAEITMTATPILGADLLPMTFRNLVQNDLINQLGFPLTQVLDGDDFDALLTEDAKLLIEGADLLRQWAAHGVGDEQTVQAQFAHLSDADTRPDPDDRLVRKPFAVG